MQQFILEIQPSNQYRIEDFIISTSNKHAYNKVIDWKDNWGINPYQKTCLISGPPSCGKTFLTKIFIHHTNAYLIKSKDNININILNSHEAFIIEDIEKFPEKKLLHFFNLINENNKYLLLTSISDKFNFKILDLASRINAILNIDLYAPDDQLLKILLFKIFSNRSIHLNSKVLVFLLNNLPREFNKIVAATEQINAYALANKRNITIPLIKQALSILL